MSSSHISPWVKSVLTCSLLLVITLLALPLLPLTAPNAFAGQATLSWTPPTANADGTPLTDLSGYKVYYGTAPGVYSQAIDVGKVTSYTVSNLPDATYYFAVTAYDASANQSGYSNAVSKTIQTIQQYALTIAKGGAGSGTVTSSPSGISCGSTCSASYNQGTVVTLTAAPSAGAAFGGWTGGGCTGTGQCAVTVNAATSVTATFSVQTFTLSASAGSGGSITPSGSVAVNYGTSKTFTITPNSGYSIASVTVDGASVGAVSAYTFTNITGSHTISASFSSADTDNDGIPDIEEYGPLSNNPSYDGNSDGTPDYLQSNVASFHTYDKASYVTLSTPNGQVLKNINAGNIPQGLGADVALPYEFIGFTVGNLTPGGSTTVTIKLPDGATVNKYFKYGPTPDNSSPHWYNFMFDGQTGAEISGNIITLHLVDGLRGDDDLAANGQIVDQGGPARTPDISAAPLSYGFGTVNVGASSPAQTFTISSVGLANLTIGSASIGGTDAGNFTISSDTCSSRVLAPSATCAINVVFSPSSAVSKSASLIVPSNDPDTPALTVALSGAGKAQQYTLTITKTGNGTVSSNPTGISCGTACSGSFASGTSITLTATPGSDSVFSGWSGGGCTGTGQCVTTLNTNTNVSATFTLKASATITATAESGGTVTPSGAVSVGYGTSKTFTITPNSGYSIATVTVDGASVGAVSTYTFTNVTSNHTLSASFAGSVGITASPASYDFSRVYVGYSLQKRVSLKNTGKSTLRVTKIEIIGTDASMFNTPKLFWPVWIAPGHSYSCKVTFKPTSKGVKNATLKITSNDPNTPILYVPLSGTGI